MPVEQVDLDLTCCRARQRWLLQTMQSLEADRAVLVRPEHVQYFTAFRPHKLMTAIVCLESDGRCTLVAPNKIPDHVAVDEVVTFEAQWHSTLRQDQVSAAAGALRTALHDRPKPKALAVEGSSCAILTYGAAGGASPVDVEPPLLKRRRNKDSDEMQLIRRAVACTEAMYQRARAIIKAGITEIEVFNQLHAAAVEIAGEPLTDLGNDYRCNDRGGSPRERAAEDGELFILDLGPAYRGYYADNCRAFAVNGKPTDEQMRAWESIVACLKMVEGSVRPGVRCREVFDRAQSMLDEHKPGSFGHHLGHGIGLYPHEAPHLNPRWDDVFEEGDVFTAEPGLYGPELRAGIRLEQNYRVTAEGVEKLTAFPLDLA